jgi:hypothetical protein
MRLTQLAQSETIKGRLSVGPWYAEGLATEVAEIVLRQPERFDELFECSLSSDKGVSKRASYALTLVCAERPDLFQPYKEVLFSELAEQDKWFVRYRLCQILPQLKLNSSDIARAVELFQGLVEDSRIALSVNALQGLAELALLDPSLKEETVWLIEQKMRSGTPGMRARGRKLLARLHKGERGL